MSKCDEVLGLLGQLEPLVAAVTAAPLSTNSEYDEACRIVGELNALDASIEPAAKTLDYAATIALRMPKIEREFIAIRTLAEDYLNAGMFLAGSLPRRRTTKRVLLAAVQLMGMKAL